LNKKLHVTLEDIAKRLNLSKGTVSEALRSHPAFSKETTKRVKKAAAELGYTPNYMARNLSKKKSNTIGVVVPKITHFFTGAVIESIYDTAFQNNYEIILTVSQENTVREIKHIESLLAMRVDGLIVCISEKTRNKEIFKKVINSGVPLIFMDRVLDIPGSSSVTVDDRAGSFRGVEFVINLGYTKIAHLGCYDEINIGRNRYLGFEDAMKKHGLTINPDWVIRGSLSEEFGYKGFKEIYDSGKIPEFVFTVTYPVALGVFTAMMELGLKIPDDINLMCFGNGEVLRFISPSINCISQPTHKIGEVTVKLILDQIKNIKSFKPQHIVLPTELIIRDNIRKK
jgi:LacI family transcriptional regulator